MPALRSLLALIAVVVLARCSSPAPQSTPYDREPTLLIIVVADGLGWETLDRYRDVYDSGFKLLLEQGRVESECRYRHAITETGPGHASIATGVPPRVHGIVANEWWEDDGGTWQKNYCADQPGRRGARGPGRLMAPTLGDALNATWPDSRVVTISGKDRAAIFLAGRDPRHAAFWYDTTSGTIWPAPSFDSSSAAGKAARAVVTKFNDTHGGEHLESRYGTIWSRISGPRPQHEPETSLAAQDPAVGIGFDHDLRKAPLGFKRGLMWSPVADALLADLAEDLVEDDTLALGRRGVPDLLAISFSALDYASHSYGTESEEAFEVLRALDRTIGRVMETAEREVGRGRVRLALTADHGFPAFAETMRRRDPGSVAQRIDTERIRTEINRALVQQWSLPKNATPVVDFDGFGLTWDRRELEVHAGAMPPPQERDRALAAAAEVVLAGIIEAAIPASAASSSPWESKRREAFFAGRSPDVYVFPRPGVIPDWYKGKGATHGSHHDYDSHVPLIFWGSGFEPSRSTAPSSPYDLAPALAREVGLTFPKPANAEPDRNPR